MNLNNDPNNQPDLDEIINQITSNGEFKEMMNSLSNGIGNIATKEGNNSGTNDNVDGNGDDNVDDSGTNNNGDDKGKNESEISDRNSNISSTRDSSIDESNLSYYDLLTTFFVDENGNNICDVLNKINTNLENISEKLNKSK